MRSFLPEQGTVPGLPGVPFLDGYLREPGWYNIPGLAGPAYINEKR